MIAAGYQVEYLICARCGLKVERARSFQRFCSRRCEARDNYERRRRAGGILKAHASSAPTTRRGRAASGKRGAGRG